MESYTAQKLVETNRKNNPRTQADFAALYNDLNEWRQAEVLKITVRDAASRQFMFFVLLSHLFLYSSLLCFSSFFTFVKINFST